MIRIRPIEMRDLDALVELASLSSGGITSLPADRTLLRERIEDSFHAFSKTVTRPKDESYLFVLETSEGVIGCSGLNSQIGEPEPPWAFHLTHHHQHSDYLPVDKQLKLLVPTTLGSGPSEICSLYLHPDHRQGGLGRLLSLSRLLFVGAFPDRFGSEIMALLRGFSPSHFFEEVMRPFFDLPFDEVDERRYRDGRFIPDLAPRHPFYVALLSHKVRSTIGKAHPNTEPALRLLKQENFHFTRWVDLLDAGPFFGAKTKEIRTLRVRVPTPVAKITNTALHSTPHLLSNERIDFRATIAHIQVEQGGVVIDAEAAAALEVKEGDTIAYAHPF
ncbi:MAG: arginine N-succinyltransferase [Parachlamydiales bacterium]